MNSSNKGGKRIQNIEKTKKKIEYSKIIVAICGLSGIYLIAFTSIVVIKTGDTSPLTYLIPSTFAAVSAALGFYFNKAKLENKLKILKSEGKDTYKELGLRSDTDDTDYYNNSNYQV